MGLDITTQITDLVKQFTEKPEQFVFFVGAGLSYPIFPTWKDLLSQLVKECVERKKLSNETELYEWIEQGKDYLDIADECAKALGTDEYRSFLEKHFDKDIDMSKLSAYQQLLTSPIRTIITTNYDHIPEVGTQGKIQTYTNANLSEAQRAINSNKHVVVKLHGDIVNQKSIVFTRQDFQNIIFANQKAKSFTESIFSSKILIFVGFSLSDPHLELILSHVKTISEGIVIPRYILLNTSSQREIHNKESAYGIRIIPYRPTDDSHPEVLKFVSLFANQTTNKAKTKSENITEAIIDIGSLDSACILIYNLLVLYGYTSYLVSTNEQTKTLSISLAFRAGTKMELQKEILDLAKGFKFRCDLVEWIEIHLVLQTPANGSPNGFFPIEVSCKLNLELTRCFVTGEIDVRTFWRSIQFFQHEEVGSLLYQKRRINIAFGGGPT